MKRVIIRRLQFRSKCHRDFWQKSYQTMNSNVVLPIHSKLNVNKKITLSFRFVLYCNSFVSAFDQINGRLL